jgi:broad specificity phosphatase PhoE
VSPRLRARKTFELLFSSAGVPLPSYNTEPDVAEWDYGAYEGLTSPEIAKLRGQKWDIWTEGAPEGESSQEMSDRCDRMIEKILEVQKKHYGDGKDGNGDVVIVSHGREHLL